MPGWLGHATRAENASQTQGTFALPDDAVTKLTGDATEDDYPVLAAAPDGSIWLAYVEYTPGESIDMLQVLDRNFASLVPVGNGDRIRLRRFDGTTWHTPLDVTESGLTVWRPTVAVDGQGNVVVAWAQSLDGDWEILYRKYTPGRDQEEDAGTWSEIVQATDADGSDFHVVSTTDAMGNVWLAWQG